VHARCFGTLCATAVTTTHVTTNRIDALKLLGLVVLILLLLIYQLSVFVALLCSKISKRYTFYDKFRKAEHRANAKYVLQIKLIIQTEHTNWSYELTIMLASAVVGGIVCTNMLHSIDSKTCSHSSGTTATNNTSSNCSSDSSNCLRCRSAICTNAYATLLYSTLVTTTAGCLVALTQ
jgi:hypothetical protein